MGLETILVRSGGAVFQVPLSYRGAPLPGADDHLVGTMEHSVLGSRWVYDACADPAYVRALAGAILAGTPQAQHVLQVDGGPEGAPRIGHRPRHGIRGCSVPEVGDVTASDAAEGTVIRSGALEILVHRRLDPAAPPAARALVGTWEGQDRPWPSPPSRTARASSRGPARGRSPLGPARGRGGC